MGRQQRHRRRGSDLPLHDPCAEGRRSDSARRSGCRRHGQIGRRETAGRSTTTRPAATFSPRRPSAGQCCRPPPARDRRRLELIEQGNRFDVAILDMHMPEMDGVTLAKRLRELPACKDMPLVLLSSVSHRMTDAETGLFAAKLTKPAKTALLGATLCAVMRKTARAGRRTNRMITTPSEHDQPATRPPASAAGRRQPHQPKSRREDAGKNRLSRRRRRQRPRSRRCLAARFPTTSS